MHVLQPVLWTQRENAFTLVILWARVHKNSVLKQNIHTYTLHILCRQWQFVFVFVVLHKQMYGMWLHLGELHRFNWINVRSKWWYPFRSIQFQFGIQNIAIASILMRMQFFFHSKVFCGRFSLLVVFHQCKLHTYTWLGNVNFRGNLLQ